MVAILSGGRGFKCEYLEWWNEHNFTMIQT